MRVVKATIGGALALVLGAGLALAGPVDGKSARKMLFKTQNMVLQALPVEGLSPELSQQVAKLIESASSRTNLKLLASSGFAYYGAMAVPTETGALRPEDVAMVANLHSPGAAQRAALAACGAAHGACAAVAVLLPKGYKAQPLSLNRAASASFFKSWNKGAGPRYMAASASSAAAITAKGAGADSVALERCNAAAGIADCSIVIADE